MTSGETSVGLRGHRVQNPERAEARRREVLLAAARVFARDGYGSTTLDEVAREVGVTKGVIYYYFHSKEEILTEIRATAIRDAIARLRPIIESDRPAAIALRDAVHDLVAHIFDELDRFANVLRVGSRLSSEHHRTVRDLQREYERMLRGLIERGIRDGVFAPRDPAVTTFTLLRACLGVADWYTTGGRLTPEQVVGQVTEQVLAGILLPDRREG